MYTYLPEIENIYFPKTKEYFNEVITSYSIGNYRSANVMLYSVAVCDILFKLQEIKDMFNDTVAEEILNEVDKSKNDNDNKSKSRWEKELIDNVHKKTELLDMEAYTNLMHLYDNRNFSAHPALNENYELISPTKETTIANINNILKNILIKPPIFIKNIINTLTEDLDGKTQIYKGSDDKLALYLNNKYYSKMSERMKYTVLKALWKFCFCLPDNEDCYNNRIINHKALCILIRGFIEETLEYIKNNKDCFYVVNNDDCLASLTILVSEFPNLYSVINEDTKLLVNSFAEKFPDGKIISWFRFKTAKEHIEYLKATKLTNASSLSIKRAINHYKNIGALDLLIDFLIIYYGKSGSYDSADNRFKNAIEPVINKMSKKQLESLIDKTDYNPQIYGRGLAYTANNTIMNYAKDILDSDFEYSKYPNFNFDKTIIHPEGNIEIKNFNDFNE